MGIRLVVEVLDHAPADLTPAERLVLVVIAEKARDDTRKGWPGMDVLIRRTGLRRSGVTRALQRLASRGLEVRVPIGKGADGRPVFAYEGTQTTYCIPDLKRVDAGTASEGGPQQTLSAREGGRSSTRGWTTVPQRVDGGPPLTLKEPSKNPQKNSLSTPVPQPREREAPPEDSEPIPVKILRKYGVTDPTEADRLVNRIELENDVQTLGWWITADRNGTLPDRLAAARDTPATSTPKGDKVPWCGRCDQRHRQRQVEGGYGQGLVLTRCPDCHPLRHEPPVGRQRHKPYVNDRLPASAYEGEL